MTDITIRHSETTDIEAIRQIIVGGRLLAAAIDLAENWLNITRLELTVFVDNAAAIALYEKHGFRIEGESPEFALRVGEYVAVYHMARLRKRIG